MNARRIALLLELPADSPDMIGMIALRRCLKALLRVYGLRCIDISEQPVEREQVPHEKS